MKENGVGPHPPRPQGVATGRILLYSMINPLMPVNDYREIEYIYTFERLLYTLYKIIFTIKDYLLTRQVYYYK